MAKDRSTRPEAKPLRLFVAVEVPEAVRAAIAEAQRPYRDRIPGARWTSEPGWHVTVKFFGATWPRLVEWVREGVVEVASGLPAFRTALTSVGVFPSPARARVLWAGLSDPDLGFARLAAAMDERFEEHFPPESRPFTPHLTLARLVPPRNLSEFAPGLAGEPIPGEPFSVSALTLYRSHLSPKGATYEPVLVAPLLGPSAASS